MQQYLSRINETFFRFKEHFLPWKTLDPSRTTQEKIFKKYGQNNVIIKDYSVIYTHKKKHFRNNFLIYADADFGYIFMKNQFALASMWFDVIFENKKKILFVKQIQGIRGKKDELKKFRWERMLLYFLIDSAKKAGFHKIRVVKSTNQSWHTSANGKNFHMRYDVSAKREGFSLTDKYHTLEISNG